jgi:hypothetical protein
MFFNISKVNLRFLQVLNNWLTPLVIVNLCNFLPIYYVILSEAFCLLIDLSDRQSFVTFWICLIFLNQLNLCRYFFIYLCGAFSYLINLNGVFITLSICVASLKQKKFCGIFADFYDFSSPIWVIISSIWHLLLPYYFCVRFIVI